MRAALNANIVLYATFEATMAYPKRSSMWGTLDQSKERSACDPTRPRPSTRPTMETEFPSPIGSILGAAVKVAPWISRRQYTDIGFGPGAMGATSDMARRIVHDYKIYRLDPRTGRPDYWNGPPFNSSLPEAVRVRCLETFIRQTATQLRLNRSVELKFNVGAWDPHRCRRQTRPGS